MPRLSILLATVLFTGAACAATPSDASISELLVAMQTERLTETAFASLDGVMQQSMAAAAQGEQLSAEQQRAMDSARPRIVQVMREELSWAQMRPLYLQIYRESFTQEEIDGLIAFYKSPAGIAYVAKMPIVLQKTTSIMQARMVPMMAKMKAAIAQAAAEAKAAK